MANCRYCGTKISENASPCPQCGATLNYQQQQAQQPYQQGQQPYQQAGQQPFPKGQQSYQQPGQQPYQQQPYQQPGQQPYQQQQGGPVWPAQNDVSQNKALAVLAYLGILVLVPIFAAKESRFARFHANQGLVLLITEVIYWVAFGIISGIFNLFLGFMGVIITSILSLASLGFLALIIIGIINAAQGKEQELPVIGKLHILNV